MKKTYQIQQPQTPEPTVLWSIIGFILIVGTVAQISETAAFIVAVAILGIGAWTALLNASERHKGGEGDGG